MTYLGLSTRYPYLQRTAPGTRHPSLPDPRSHPAGLASFGASLSTFMARGLSLIPMHITKKSKGR